jgi:ribose transport system substrate-binding protein
LKKKWIVSLVCLTVLISFIVHFLKEDEKLKVVVVAKSLNLEYWKIFEAGAKKAFDDFDIDGQVIAPNSIYPITNEANTLKKILRIHPDALIVTPMHPSVTIPVLMEYKKNNIPVLFAGRDADWKDKVTYIGTDHFKLGIMAGSLLGSMLQPGDQVAIIHGTLKDPAEVERLKGAKDVLGKAGIEIATEQLGEDRLGKTISVIENILQNHPDIQGVFATDDLMALDVLKKVETEGLMIPIVGTDGITEMMEIVDAGKLNATVAQNPYDMGYLSVEQAIKAVKGEYVPERIDSGVDILTKDNAEDKLAFLNDILYSRVEKFKHFLYELL